MRISLNIATHKPRLKSLRECLKAVALQTVKPDIVNVYFNDCKAPKWVSKFDINVIEGKDLGAAAKFYHSEHQTEGVYITLDDDLIPDERYIEYMANAAMRYYNCIVGLHGSIFLTHPIEKYWGGEYVNFHYVQSLDSDKAVDVLGTGVMAFRCALKGKPVLSDYKIGNATDPMTAKKAKDHGIPLVCLYRPERFISNVPDSQSVGIYHDVAKDDSKHIKIINSIKNFDRQYQRKPLRPSQFGGASIEWNHLKEILSVINIDSNVVEFGSGKSTDALARCCSLISFEHDKDYAHSLSKIRELKSGWYDLTNEDKEAIKTADIILVDGPIGKDRANMPDKIIKLFSKDSIIFVDDVNREGDMKLAKRISRITKKKITVIEGKKSMAKIQ